MKIIAPFLALLCLSAGPAAALRAAGASATTPQDTAASLALQAARAKTLAARGNEVAYHKHWDVGTFPHYVPGEPIHGVIRMWGSNYVGDGNLKRYWEEGFRRFQPGASFSYNLSTTILAVPALFTGAGDLGPSRRITFAELLGYQRTFNCDPLEVSFATGSLNVPGWNPCFVIIVPKTNPLTQITMRQLDGIFGAERLGGWIGTAWHGEFARGPEGNIRTWGQVGLTGAWADQPIIPYGLNLRYHQATEVSDMILKGSDKWNEKLRIYANFVGADGKLGRGLYDDLRKDPYGIAYVAGTKGLPDFVKILPIVVEDGGPAVKPTLETVHDRSYPLHDEVFFYANKLPGHGMDPKVREFLRYVLSQEGQLDIIRDGKYLPLTAEVEQAMLQRLN